MRKARAENHRKAGTQEELDYVTPQPAPPRPYPAICIAILSATYSASRSRSAVSGAGRRILSCPTTRP